MWRTLRPGKKNKNVKTKIMSMQTVTNEQKKRNNNNKCQQGFIIYVQVLHTCSWMIMGKRGKEINENSYFISL